MQIRDAQNQRSADVTVNGRLKVRAVQSSVERSINEDSGKVWSAPFKEVDPTGADDYFFYIKNDGSKIIEITDVRIDSTVVGRVEVQVVSGIASGGSTITPVGRNLGVSASPSDIIVESGVDITGLTNDGVIFFIPIGAVDTEKHLKTSAGIIIPPNKAIALLWDTGTGILTGEVSFHERD